MSAAYTVRFHAPGQPYPGPPVPAPQVVEAHNHGHAAELAIASISDDYRMPATRAYVSEVGGKTTKVYELSAEVVYRAEEIKP